MCRKEEICLTCPILQTKKTATVVRAQRASQFAHIFSISVWVFSKLKSKVNVSDSRHSPLVVVEFPRSKFFALSSLPCLRTKMQKQSKSVVSTRQHNVFVSKKKGTFLTKTGTSSLEQNARPVVARSAASHVKQDDVT